MPSSGRLRVSSDMVSLQALHEFVEECVAWWQRRVQGGEITREDAAHTIEELRQALLSLSRQIANGRTLLRVTTTLPAARRFPVGCPRCGRGNRSGAHFCYACGWAFEPLTAAPADPSPQLRFQTGLATDPGRVRSTNQDAAAVVEIPLPDGSLALCCLVADGMGGAAAGAQASQLASSTIIQQLHRRLRTLPASDEEWRYLLRDVLVEANSAVYAQGQSDPAMRGMGTTVVLALLVGQQAHLASVGDSRIYLANQRGITEDGVTWALLTVDHTIVARLVDLGIISPDEARNHPRRSVLYRSVGVERSVEVDTDSQPLQPGDRLLLCSDGLSSGVDGEELANMLIKAPAPQVAADRLVTLSRQRDGRDNLTALVVAVEAA